MIAPAATPPRRGFGTGWLLALALAVTCLASCAGPAKLARKSQEQLAKGEVRKAYETALKAVDKDPYNEAARAALGDAGAALMGYELRTLRSTVQVDTVEAAEVALRMVAIRTETARRGVSLPVDSLAAAEAGAVRSGAARVFLRLGDEQMALGHPKAAYGHFLAARRFAPELDGAAVDARLEESYKAAVDRVLVAPASVEIRTGIDREAFSQDLYDELAGYAESDLRFTELLGRGEAWEKMLAMAPGRLTRDTAIRLARGAGATRVAWTRIYGDRVVFHSESFAGVLYHEAKRKRADGSQVLVWEEVPYRAAIQDIWASVALESEVYDVAGERVVARRTGERGAGLRALHSSTAFAGDADDYALFTPAMESEDRDHCKALRREWSDAMGDLSVKDFITHANAEPRVIVFGRAKKYGRASRNNRAYAIYYGTPPAETQLIQNALSDAWRETAAALREADED